MVSLIFTNSYIRVYIAQAVNALNSCKYITLLLYALIYDNFVGFQIQIFSVWEILIHTVL